MSTSQEIPAEGTVERVGDAVIVRVPGKAHLLNEQGVYCENPTADESERIYAKKFVKNRVYLPDEYERAVKEVLGGNDVVVLAMNGYSSLKPEVCRAWGVKEGAYEAACEGILLALYEALCSFKGIDIRFAHGASSLGVDKVQIKVANQLNRAHLGHSCPKFMMYVEDTGMAVHVANTQLEYADRFTSSLDILIGANGRKQAFEMDIDAVFKKQKNVIPVNVLRSISSNGGPPAFGPDGFIEDAVAAFLKLMHVAPRQTYESSDPYRDVVTFLCDRAVSIVRPMISPERAFGNPLPVFHGQQYR